jgi:hypothetical protein
MTNEIINLISNLTLALSVIFGLVFGIVQVKAAARDRRERIALDALGRFQTREFVELFHHVTTTKFPKSREVMLALPEREQVLFIQYAQEMESLGILVAEKLISIELVDKTIGSLVTTTWERYRPMYLDMRVKLPDPFLGEYFQWLAEEIDQRMRECPRKPFYEVRPHSQSVTRG